MAWAKIEIEFRPEDFDRNEVMNMLADYFTGANGIPKAAINFIGISPDEIMFDASSLEELADQIWQMFDPKKIDAIKELRLRTHLGLKDAKDAIDNAIRRNPF